MSMKRATIAALIATVVAVALALPLDIERPSDDAEGLITSTDVPYDSGLDVKTELNSKMETEQHLGRMAAA